MNPVLLQIGPLAIRWYGVLLVGGALLATYFTAKDAERAGQDPDTAWDMLIWVLFTGIVGARLYHVFSEPAGGAVGWSYYRENPLDILKVWHGGLAIYGGLLGGLFGLATYAWKYKLPMVTWFDAMFPNVLLGQAIGRWGNFVNQEAYGAPTDLPWAIPIAPEHRIQGYEQFTHFHPTFLYESIWCVLGWLLIRWISRRYETRLRPGDLAASYFVWYPLGRFWIESLRIDAWTMGSLATAQWISLVMVILAVAFLVGKRLLRPEEPAATRG